MDNNEFGDYLRKLRQDKKMTIRQLENKSGVSNGYISNFERGDRGIPHPDILRKLASPLGVEYGHLMHKAGYIDSYSYADWLDDDDEIYAKWNENKAKKRELEKSLDESFYWWTKFISDEDGYFDEYVQSDIKELVDKYDIEYYQFSVHGSWTTPTSLWEEVNEMNDISLKSRVVDEIIQICEKHNEYTRVLRESSNESESAQLDLLKFMSQEKLFYGDIPLEETDYKLIKGMLHVMFQERFTVKKPFPQIESDDNLPE